MFTADMVSVGQRYIENFHRRGREWHGACPQCGGKDRFVVLPKEYRYFCRQCGSKGDAIAFVMLVKGLSFKEAKLDPDVGTLFSETRAKAMVRRSGVPAPRQDYPAFREAWQRKAKPFIFECKDRLWSRAGEKALRYLTEDRKLTLPVIADANLGYTEEYRSQWDDQTIHLPRGIIIPWLNDDVVWRVNCRPPVPVGGRKYIQATGGANGLYRSDALLARQIAVMVEGEFDALTIVSHAPQYAVVGTGTVSWARTLLSLTQLSIAPLVLLGFDSDEAGDSAAAYWLESLGERQAMRVRPTAHDANDLARIDPRLIAEWLAPEPPPADNGWPTEAVREQYRHEMSVMGYERISP